MQFWFSNSYIDLNDILHPNFCCIHIFLIKICRWNKCLGVHINSQENYVFHLGASSKKICCHNTYHERYNRNIVTLIQCVKKINELFKLFVRKKIGSLLVKWMSKSTIETFNETSYFSYQMKCF